LPAAVNSSENAHFGNSYKITRTAENSSVCTNHDKTRQQFICAAAQNNQKYKTIKGKNTRKGQQ